MALEGFPSDWSTGSAIRRACATGGESYGPLDAAVRDHIVTETHGNPLALLELPRKLEGPQILLAGSGCPTASRWSARSNRATSGASA